MAMKALFAFFAIIGISSAELCIVGKTIIREGESYARSLCTTCVCRNGKLDCARPACPPLNCGHYEDPGTYEGECCPVCIPRKAVDPAPPARHSGAGSCSVEGEYVDPENPCLKCSCHNGLRACEDISDTCNTGSCAHLMHVEGECCPQCLQAAIQFVPSAPTTCLHDNGEVMSSGSSFLRDSCTTCTCSNGLLLCMAESCAHTECPHGQVPVTQPGQCCPTCPPPPSPQPSLPQPSFNIARCVEGKSKRGGNCRRCRCINGVYQCFTDRTLCLTRPSTDRKAPGGRCEVGSTMRDGCRGCVCIGGKFACKRDPALCTDENARQVDLRTRN